MKKKADVVLNPVRMRIIQYAARHQPVTVDMMASALSDISKPTLYRHVKVLVENEILLVVGEKKKRGTYEQSYSLNLSKVTSTGQESSEDMEALVYSILAKLIEDFRQYFSQEGAKPVEDKLFVGVNTLYLDDSSFDRFVHDIYEVVSRYIQAPVGKEAKVRMISMISSPAYPAIDGETSAAAR